MCASPQFHKFESLISFHAQAEDGSELEEYYHSTICKPDLIYISQESDHITIFLEQYLHHLALLHLTQRAYQLLTMVVSETDRKLYYARCDLAIVCPPSHSICLRTENTKSFSKSLHESSFLISLCDSTSYCVKFSSSLQRLKKIYLLIYYQKE